jgi:hypothetical protein
MRAVGHSTSVLTFRDPISHLYKRLEA